MNYLFVNYSLKIGSIVFVGLSIGLFLSFSLNNFETNFNTINTFDYNVPVGECCETTCFVVPEQVVRLNFDKIFPETCLSNVFDCCAKVYQEVDLIAAKDFFKISEKNGENFEREFDVFTDLLVGKLFNIKVCMSKVQVFNDQDIDYLNKVFDKMLFEYQLTCASCRKLVNNKKSENVSVIIKAIKRKLNK